MPSNEFSVRVPLLTDVVDDVRRLGVDVVLPEDILFTALARVDDKTRGVLAAAGVTKEVVRRPRTRTRNRPSDEVSPQFSTASKAIVSEAIGRALTRRGTPEVADFILAIFGPELAKMEELLTLFARIGVTSELVYPQLGFLSHQRE